MMSSKLTTDIVRHDRVRLVGCILCGHFWEEQWVGAGLYLDEEVLGSVCPNCLNRSPRDIADRFRQVGEECLKQADLFRRPAGLLKTPVDYSMERLDRAHREAEKQRERMRQNMAQ